MDKKLEIPCAERSTIEIFKCRAISRTKNSEKVVGDQAERFIVR